VSIIEEGANAKKTNWQFFLASANLPPGRRERRDCPWQGDLGIPWGPGGRERPPTDAVMRDE
jgi:hypothetical protein